MLYCASRPAIMMVVFLQLLLLPAEISAQETTRPSLFTPMKPLFDYLLRDTSICLGRRGTYYLTAPEFVNDDHHCDVASSDKVYGPRCGRYLAAPHSGHYVSFKDRDGVW